MNAVYVKRGDVWMADLGENEGSEQRGIRPVLILQNDVGNRFSPTVIVASITEVKREDLPVHVSLGIVDGLNKPSSVLLEQIRTIDKRKLRNRVSELSDAVMKKVDEGLRISVGLSSGHV